MPLIPAFKRQRQAEFEASQVYIARPCLKKEREETEK